MTTTLDARWAGGRRLDDGVFAPADGDADAPVVSGLRGFPTSSWDWAPLLEARGPGRRNVTLDFLGRAHVLPTIRERMPDAELHVLDGVGHYPQLEATERVAAVLR